MWERNQTIQKGMDVGNVGNFNRRTRPKNPKVQDFGNLGNFDRGTRLKNTIVEDFGDLEKSWSWNAIKEHPENDGIL